MRHYYDPYSYHLPASAKVPEMCCVPFLKRINMILIALLRELHGCNFNIFNGTRYVYNSLLIAAFLLRA